MSNLTDRDVVEKSIADYLNAGVDAQLKCDLLIEATIGEKLQTFDLDRTGGRRPAERWTISPANGLAK